MKRFIIILCLLVTFITTAGAQEDMPPFPEPFPPNPFMEDMPPNPFPIEPPPNPFLEDMPPNPFLDCPPGVACASMPFEVILGNIKNIRMITES